MKIIVGLGNPGERYEGTRHNAGWLALNVLVGETDWCLEKKFNALIKKEAGNIYLKPLSFMNRSGENTYQALRYYHLIHKKLGVFLKSDQNLKDVLAVIHDDLDLNLGNWKISDDSRSGGNKGVQSIIKHLKTQKFQRLRLGIKTDLLRNPIPAEKFVLQKFPSEELKQINSSLNEALDCFKKSFLI